MTEIPAHRRRVRPPAHAVTHVLDPATNTYVPAEPGPLGPASPPVPAAAAAVSPPTDSALSDSPPADPSAAVDTTNQED